MHPLTHTLRLAFKHTLALYCGLLFVGLAKSSEAPPPSPAFVKLMAMRNIEEVVQTLVGSTWGIGPKLDMTSAEWFAFLERAMREIPAEKASFSLMERVDAFNLACLHGDRDRLPKLLHIFVSSDFSFQEKEYAFKGLAQLWLRLKAEDWQTTPPPAPRFPDTGIDDAAIQNLSPDQQQAWQAYRRAATARNALEPSYRTWADQEKAPNYISDRTVFWSLFGDLLADTRTVSAREILNYTWGSSCGTGSQNFYYAREQAALIALARAGQTAECIGSIFRQPFDYMPSFFGFVPSYDVNMRLLRLCSGSATEAEKLCLGALVDADNNSTTFNNSLLRKNALLMLLVESETRPVELVLNMARRAPTKAIYDYMKALAPLLQSHEQRKQPQIRSFSLPLPPPLPDGPLRTEIVHFFAGQAAVSPTSLTVDQTRETIRWLEDNHDPVVIKTLHSLLAHPSSRVADAAAAALKRLGINAIVPKKPKSAPLRYRLLVNGQPQPNLEVRWTITRQTPTTRDSIEGVSSHTRTHSDGVLEISRDYLIDADGAQVSIQLDSGIRFASLQPGGLDQPIFCVLLPAPRQSDDGTPTDATDATIDVPLTLTSMRLKIVLPRPASEFAGQKMHVSLRPGKDASKAVSFFFCDAELPVADTVDIALIMAGKHTLSLSIPDVATWSGQVDPSDPGTHTLTLKPQRPRSASAPTP
ncbi:hypothetical protein [Geminisphaera colitermitum]|uniref:hypothetical protein n=1 Tax=Geminisphaera colitermitum TaxID=1148786 RepID=UPI000158C5B7|nr:hypothetical protein [Geminisphaera colitermitum]